MKKLQEFKWEEKKTIKEHELPKIDIAQSSCYFNGLFYPPLSVKKNETETTINTILSADTIPEIENPYVPNSTKNIIPKFNIFDKFPNVQGNEKDHDSALLLKDEQLSFYGDAWTHLSDPSYNMPNFLVIDQEDITTCDADLENIMMQSSKRMKIANDILPNATFTHLESLNTLNDQPSYSKNNVLQK